MAGLNFGKSGVSAPADPPEENPEDQAPPENQDPQDQVDPAPEEEETVDVVVFSSHPIHRFNMGDYTFENGQLRLSPTEAVAFEELLASQPQQVRNMVKKLDVAAAEALIAARIASTTTTGIQSTQGSTVPGSAAGIVTE